MLTPTADFSRLNDEQQLILTKIIKKERLRTRRALSVALATVLLLLGIQWYADARVFEAEALADACWAEQQSTPALVTEIGAGDIEIIWIDPRDAGVVYGPWPEPHFVLDIPTAYEDCFWEPVPCRYRP